MPPLSAVLAQAIVYRLDKVIRSTIVQETRDETLISVELLTGRASPSSPKDSKAAGPGGRKQHQASPPAGNCGDHTLNTEPDAMWARGGIVQTDRSGASVHSRSCVQYHRQHKERARYHDLAFSQTVMFASDCHLVTEIHKVLSSSSAFSLPFLDSTLTAS